MQVRTKGNASRSAGQTNSILAEELEGLARLKRDQLKQRWEGLYQTAPPSKIGQALLQCAIAYALQEKALGGLKPAVAKLVDGSLKSKPPVPVNLHPGTKLLREWNGTVHEVEIREGFVMYRGERHRSLSEVAKRITGSHRSGPLFFGLMAKPKDKDRSAAS